MRRSVRVLPEALAELDEAVSFYESRSEGLGESFRKEMDRLVGLAASHPERFERIRGTIRKAVSHSFPFVVVFKTNADHLFVLGFRHVRREPRSW